MICAHLSGWSKWQIFPLKSVKGTVLFQINSLSPHKWEVFSVLQCFPIMLGSFILNNNRRSQIEGLWPVSKLNNFGNRSFPCLNGYVNIILEVLQDRYDTFFLRPYNFCFGQWSVISHYIPNFPIYLY